MNIELSKENKEFLQFIEENVKSEENRAKIVHAVETMLVLPGIVKEAVSEGGVFAGLAMIRETALRISITEIMFALLDLDHVHRIEIEGSLLHILLETINNIVCEAGIIVGGIVENALANMFEEAPAMNYTDTDRLIVRDVDGKLVVLNLNRYRTVKFIPKDNQIICTIDRGGEDVFTVSNLPVVDKINGLIMNTPELEAEIRESMNKNPEEEDEDQKGSPGKSKENETATGETKTNES